MSGINGDKARFNRIRKQRIQRRMRDRVMYSNLALERRATPSKAKLNSSRPASQAGEATHE